MDVIVVQLGYRFIQAQYHALTSGSLQLNIVAADHYSGGGA